MLKSIFESRPMTIFFQYPEYCAASRSTQNTEIFTQNEFKKKGYNLSFRVTGSTHVYNSVVNSMKNAGFSMTSSSNWNMLWTGIPRPDTIKNATKYQKINHFPSTMQLGRKDNMWRNVFRLKRKFGKDYEICPKTYIFPEDTKRFKIDRENEKNNVLYILKPAALSCGRGIRIITKNTNIGRRRGYVASRYIHKPHLINGFKYDLRLYILVTSFDPLKVYMYDEGLVRFATEKYSTKKGALKKRFVHLTNYSNYKPNNLKQENSENNSKWTLTMLQNHFVKEGIPYKEVFEGIKDVIIKSLIAVEPHIVNNYNRFTKHKNACFEVYGFDVLLDYKLRPWILEVNVCPSLSSSSYLDKKIKTMMLCDVFHCVGFMPYDRK